MLAVSEGNVFRRRVDKLVLRTLAGVLAHAREAEGVELIGVGVVRVVVVHPVRVRRHERAGRDERSVAQHDVFQRFAPDRGCARPISVGMRILYKR